MGTKVRDLIAKLQEYDLDLEVVIEPNIDYQDADSMHEQAHGAITNKLSPIVLRTAHAQRSDDDDTTLYAFDTWEVSDNDKKVLVVSSQSLKHGKGT